MIGIFDSGVGGLTVLKSLIDRLPQYNYLYLGDTARAPYGNRSQELVYQFTEQAVDFLFQQGCQLVILACNTVSAKALRQIQQEWLPKAYPDRRVLGVIRPIAEEAVKLTQNNRVAVIGTRGTIDSNIYAEELKALKPDITVVQKPCPLLVPLVEEGKIKTAETKRILKSYLQGLKTKNVDTLILGCTHFSALEKSIVQIMGSKRKILNTGQVIAAKLEDYLQRHPEVESKLPKDSKYKLLFTDPTPNLKTLISQIVQKNLPVAKAELKCS